MSEASERVEVENGARRAWVAVVLAITLAVVTTLRLHVPAWSASNLNLVPDAVIYAVPAERWVSVGSFDLEIEGVRYPPPGSSCYSSLVLAPVFAVMGPELGNAIYPVLGAAVLSIVLSFLIARRIGGDWGGAFAAAALLLNPKFERWSREVMTDVPALALGLAAAWLFVHPPKRRAVEDWSAGFAVAACVAMRGTLLALALPFAWRIARDRSRPRAARFVALASPIVAVLAANAAYNALAVGAWNRGGYQVWTAVPMDYRELVVGARYFASNVAVFADPWMWAPLAAAAIAAVLAFARKRREELAWVPFTLFGALPITLFHLGYYFPAARFHLLLVAVCTVGACGTLASCLPSAVASRGGLALPLVAALAFWPAIPEDPRPRRREIAEEMRANTPPDAIVITSLDPVYLEPLYTRGTQRRVVPENREVAFANRFYTPERVADPDPPPRDAQDRRCEGLRRAGARDVVEFTADEQPERIVAWVAQGRAVFVDASLESKTRTLERLGRHGLAWDRVEGSAALVRLRKR